MYDNVQSVLVLGYCPGFYHVKEASTNHERSFMVSMKLDHNQVVLDNVIVICVQFIESLVLH